MCYYVLLASDHPLPLRQPPEGERGFSVYPAPEAHPVRRWLSKPYVVEFGARTGCACGLDFALDYQIELGEEPEYAEDLTPRQWQDRVEEYQKDRQCLSDYFAYLRQALAFSDLEWYCCWEGCWDSPPVRRETRTILPLAHEPDFQKDYPLESGWMILYEKK